MTQNIASKAFIALLVFSSPGLACRGAALAGSVSITPEQVTVAMNTAGLGVTTRQIALPGNIMASTPNPALKVGAIETWGGREIRVRIECANPTECIPFFVAVHTPQLPKQPGHSEMPATEPGLLSNSAPVANLFLVRTGSAALLLLEGEHIRIRLPVICLEDGRTGQVVRVTSKDGRQTYTAEVVSRNALKGRLE
jgi:hypothetical protein